MGKSNKAITKCCPHCEMQIAVACKICPGCKRVLISNNKKVTPPAPAPTPPPPPPPEPVLSSRRTSRIKREKPQFYDASQFEKKKQIKRKRLEPAEIPKAKPPPPPPAPALNRKKIKKKVKTSGKDDQPEPDDAPLLNLTPQKIKQLSTVLSELNNKLFSTSWSAL